MLSTKLVKSFTVVVFVCCAITSKSQSLDSELEAVFTQYQLLGMSVHVSSGSISNTYSYGLRDVNRNLPVTNMTTFRIASISKAITALGVLKLADNELVDLDEDISTYLGYQVRNPSYPNTAITLRMLLSHQSSLQDGSGYNNFLNATFSQTPIPNINQLILPNGNFYTTNMWRTEAPGSYFAYSNLNFGILGTIIEAVSNQRFDEYMKTEILEPLGISGSYNIQDLDNINNLATLYRYVAGNWQPQQDNYEGILPPPPDLSNYELGANGLYFAPQGGLRCTAQELSLFLTFLYTNGTSSDLNINASTIAEMKAITWNSNGSNGDTYGGLFNRWGLGLHHANVTSGDAICPGENFNTFIGHPGEAYGLVSDAFFLEDQPIQFSLLINGSQNGYQLGTNTSFYTVEAAIFEKLCAFFSETLSSEQFNAEDFVFFPNPAQTFITIENKTAEKFNYELLSVTGKQLATSEENVNSSTITVSNLPTGVYFLKISTQRGTLTKKISIE